MSREVELVAVLALFVIARRFAINEDGTPRLAMRIRRRHTRRAEQYVPLGEERFPLSHHTLAPVQRVGHLRSAWQIFTIVDFVDPVQPGAIPPGGVRDRLIHVPLLLEAQDWDNLFDAHAALREIGGETLQRPGNFLRHRRAWEG